jgi:hypothetical protein
MRRRLRALAKESIINGSVNTLENFIIRLNFILTGGALNGDS